MSSASSNTPQDRSNTKLSLKLVGVVVAMFGFGYAMVPLFELFCEIAGIGDNAKVITATEASAARVDLSRLVTVEFVASTSTQLPWQFAPLTKTLRVHPGETAQAIYVAENTASRPITGQATYSLAPIGATRYFSKTECFCFTNQRLEAGERVEMAVVFVVDADLPKDVNTVTLSYSFFNADKYAGSTSGRFDPVYDGRIDNVAVAWPVIPANSRSRREVEANRFGGETG